MTTKKEKKSPEKTYEALKADYDDAQQDIEDLKVRDCNLDDYLEQRRRKISKPEAKIGEPEGDKARLEKLLETRSNQRTTRQDSSTQTVGTQDEGLACQSTVAHGAQASVRLRAGLPESPTSQSGQDGGIAKPHEEIDRLRQENIETKCAVEQAQKQDNLTLASELQVIEILPEENKIECLPHEAEIQSTDVEMGGTTTAQDSTTPREDATTENEAVTVPEPMETSESTYVIRINLRQVLNDLDRGLATQSDEEREKRDERRRERRRQRRYEREREGHRPRKNRHNSTPKYQKIRPNASQAAWIKYSHDHGHRSFLDFYLPFLGHMFPRRFS
ncbi:hypothetical protein IL306_014040 [Fusarium sp. DS 682]|nr:hypothetical protein IL306_014040 [Fusarium sp. DS 682]